MTASSREFRVLCAAARAKLTDPDRERISRSLGDSLDEELLLRLVDRHRVAPLLLRGLGDLDFSGFSQRLRAALQWRARANSARALRQTAELLTLYRAFQGEGISVLAMKGVALAACVYGDVALRQVGDIDLLVEPSRVLAAERIAVESGYVRIGPGHSLTPRQTETFMRERKHFHYVHPESERHLELHWRCFNNPRLFPVETDQLLAGAESLEIGGASVPVMSTVDRMLFLCAHGANHGWFRLVWLCDVHELLTSDAVASKLDEVRRRARELGVDRMLLQACMLAHEVLETPVPGSLLEEARDDPAVMDLVGAATRALLEDERRWWISAPLRDLWNQTRYRMKLRPQLRYKLRGLRTLMFNADDWDSVALPDRVFPVYLVLRPLLAIKRRLSSGSWRSE